MASTGLDISSREWWSFIPENERALYKLAGFSGEQSFEGKTGLLVIDVTHNFTGTRDLPIAEAIKEFPTSCGEYAWRALPHIKTLLEAFRQLKLPIVYTGRDVAAQEATTGSTKRRGNVSDGNDYVDMVKPGEDEWICTKARASAFYGTPLDAYFRIQGVQSLVVCGGSTSGCVRASSVDAFSAGYKVIVAEEACFDRARTPHLANLFDLHAKYGTVMTTAAITNALARQSAFGKAAE
jgi:nicotinamidase-related amidase